MLFPHTFFRLMLAGFKLHDNLNESFHFSRLMGERMTTTNQSYVFFFIANVHTNFMRSKQYLLRSLHTDEVLCANVR